MNNRNTILAHRDFLMMNFNLNTMKETPIIFSTPMVQAILEGRKTQTRRIVKGKALEWLAPGMFTPESVSDPDNYLCPYGQPGDLLWVRETFCADYYDDGIYVYKSLWNSASSAIVPQPKWKPSIHMPKSAARIWLRIAGVRIERLQDISEADAISEGIEIIEDGMCEDPITSFKLLWESIHGNESWDSNAWVYVITFEKVPK